MTAFFPPGLFPSSDISSTTSNAAYSGLTSVARSQLSHNSDVINVLNFGVKGDGVSATHSVTVLSSTPNRFQISGFTFTSADIGKHISISGVGPSSGPFSSTITSVIATNIITTTDNATTFLTTATSCEITYGTDDGPAINAIIATIRSSLTTGSMVAGRNVTIYYPNRLYIIATSINYTVITALTFKHDGATFYGVTNGTAVFDAMGAYNCVWDQFYLIGDQALPPSTGMQIGRYVAGSAFGLNRLRDTVISGYFTIAALYNMASETTFFDRVSSFNSLAGGYGYIADGINHFGLTSQYVTISLPANTQVTFSVNTHEGCRYGSPGGGVSAIWVSGFSTHHYRGCYFYSLAAQDSVTVYAGNSFRINDWSVEASCEGGPNATLLNNIFNIIDDGTHVTSITNWTIEVPGSNATNSIIQASSTFTNLVLKNLQLQSGGVANVNGLLFGYPTPMTVSGDIKLGSSYTFVPPGVEFVGTISTVDYSAVYGMPTLSVNGGTIGGGLMAIGASSNAFGTSTTAIGAHSYAYAYGKIAMTNGYLGTNGGAQDGQVILMAATVDTTPARLTANNGSNTVTSGNIGNPYPGSAHLVNIQLIARDQTTGDVASWISGLGTPGYPFIFSRPTTGTVYITGSPTFTLVSNTGAGSLTGSPTVTISADTTFSGLNITVTATGTNTVHWVARIRTVEII